MATGPSSTGDGGPTYPSLIPRQTAGNSADELRLLWRALLLVSGDPAMAEAALVATVEACRPWSERPDRLTIWCTGFRALEAEEQRTDVHLLGTPDNGPRASDIKAITNYLDATTPARARLLVGHHIGDLSTEDLRLFVADGKKGEELEPNQLVDWVEHDSGAAAKLLLIKPQHWIDVLSLLHPLVRPERLLRADSRPWRSGATVGGLAVALLLFLALFSVNRGSPPVADDRDGVSPVAGDVTGDLGGDPGADVTDTGTACPAVGLASRVLTSPVYQAGLQPRPFPEVLERSELVVRGAVFSIELEGGGIRFELDGQRVLFGPEPAPSSFFLNARFNAAGDPVPNGVLFPDAVVFLKQAGDRWEVAEAGGIWVGCEPDVATAVGASWPTGPLWPEQPTPSELARVIDETLQENAQFSMVRDGQRTIGGFLAFDGRTVVLQLPSGMQPAGEMSARVRPLPDVLAVVGGPDLQLVLREQACDPVEQSRAPLAVCSSDGQLTIEIASPVELSDAWLERIDVFTVEDEELQRSDLVMEETRAGEIVAIDPAVPDIVWRASLRPGESLAAVGESEVAALAEGNLRMLDATSGAELWRKKINPITGAVPVLAGWLVTPLEFDPPRLELVEGATGEVLWRGEPDVGVPKVAFADDELILVERWIDNRVRSLLGLASVDGQLLWVTEPEIVTNRLAVTLMVDRDRKIVATVDDEGFLRLVDLADGRTRWTTGIPSATSIDGISLSTMTVNSGSGQLVTVSLADGTILPP